jgi:hypothetical protein
MLTWKHSGFSLDAGDKPVSSYNIAGRRNLAEYMLRAPFSLEKVTWNEKAKKVIYRSKRSWLTKQNFQVFTASDFIAATVEHIPPKSQQCLAAIVALNLAKRNRMDGVDDEVKPFATMAATPTRGGDGTSNTRSALR